jgi:hypothetical protein
MKVSLASLVALLALFFVHSCKELPTQTEKPIVLSLSVMDSTCTEIEINLNLDYPNGQRIVVERDDNIAFIGFTKPSVVIFDAVLNKPDTSILDTGLLPNTSYTYRAYHLANNVKRDSTPALLARTMDTTSHDWTWTMQTFGDFGSSAFYDVAIINDTLAYAVGEIYLNDSLGQRDPTPYNLAIWNGQRWRFERVLHFFQGNQLYSPLTSIFVFDEHDIWLGAGGGLFRKNGQNWQVILLGVEVFPASPVNKIWGRSSSDVYIVGNGGNIAHYNGSSWRKIESGTSLDIYDIYGDGEEVFAAGTSFQTAGRTFLRLFTNRSQSLSTTPIQWSIQSLWFQPNRRYYVVGSGIYEKRQLTGSLWRNKPLDITTFYTTCIRGNDINDVLVVGAFGEVLHFNGVSWRSYRATQTAISGSFGDIALKGKLAMLTGGLNNGRAIVAIGRRNKKAEVVDIQK